MNPQISRRLKMLGMLLFLIGLITGFATNNFRNPRMGLAAHLEGVMNGTFLVVTGIIWKELKIAGSLKTVVYWSLIYGCFINWFSTLVAAFFGTSKTTPIAGAGFAGTTLQEHFVSFGFISVGLTMVFSVSVIVYGLRGRLSE